MGQHDYVWYASYGSNINKDRFLCYIRGGTPIGSDKEERGCRDPSLPKDEKSFIIHHQLYFAKESIRWKRMGVCFIDLDFDKKYETQSYMYLVTREQFLDIVSQENGIDNIELDLDRVIAQKSLIFRDSRYGNLLCIGESGGYPVFTFTSPYPLNAEEINKPSDEYLKTIIIGLKREVGLTNEQIAAYFSTVPGIKSQFTMEELQKLIMTA